MHVLYARSSIESCDSFIQSHNPMLQRAHHVICSLEPHLTYTRRYEALFFYRLLVFNNNANLAAYSSDTFAYMDKKAKEKMKVKLLAEKERLEQELSSFAHRIPNTKGSDFQTDFPNLGEKEDENASEVAQFSDNLSLENELEKALRDVDSAIKAVDDDKYGTCKYCQQPIDERRLKARPTSSSCIACKKTLTQEL